MTRQQIEASVQALITAYDASGKAKSPDEAKAADIAGRAALANIAVDTLEVLHRLADCQERIAVAIEKMANTPDLFGS